MSRVLVILVSLASLFLLACGFAAAPPTPTPSPTEIPIPAGATIIDFEIAAQDLKDKEVKVGTYIRWTNITQVGHSISHTPTQVGAPKLFDTFLQSGDTIGFLFDKPGEYRYACLVHPVQMNAVISVTE